jgi:hypothetical protein
VCISRPASLQKKKKKKKKKKTWTRKTTGTDFVNPSSAEEDDKYVQQFLANCGCQATAAVHLYEFCQPRHSRHSLVGIVIEQRAEKPRNRDSIPEEGGTFSSLQSVQTVSGSHPATHSMSSGGFIGSKAAVA